MEINLKNLEEAIETSDEDIDMEAIDVSEIIKDFVAKIADFLSKIRASNRKLKNQLDTFKNIDIQVNPDAILNEQVHGYPRERFNFLATEFVRTTKDVRSVVRYLSNDSLDNAAKMADRVANYLGMRNDVFRLKKDPEVPGRSRATLKEHGFTLRSMVEHMGRISDYLDNSELDQLRKSVENLMGKAEDGDQWVKTARRFAEKAISELAEIIIELGTQQIKMVEKIQE